MSNECVTSIHMPMHASARTSARVCAGGKTYAGEKRVELLKHMMVVPQKFHDSKDMKHVIFAIQVIQAITIWGHIGPKPYRAITIQGQLHRAVYTYTYTYIQGQLYRAVTI